MKRKISFILALILALACLVSCGDTGNTSTTATSATTTATTAIVIPASCQKYSDGYISFAYPKAWTKTNGSVTILTDPSGSGNNITVVYENKNTYYDTLTLATFNSQMKPSYEAMGMQISGASVTRKTFNGENVLVISYSARVQSRNVKQTQYVLHSGARTYTVTVSEFANDGTLTQNVTGTLDALK